MALGVPGIWNIFRPFNGAENANLATSVAGIPFPNPVGLAAGFDKDCKVLGSALHMGFGFATGGTVTLSSRPGNPKPRVVRVSDRKAVMNSLGFPGLGLAAAENRLQKSQKYRGRVLVSVSGTIEDEVIFVPPEVGI